MGYLIQLKTFSMVYRTGSLTKGSTRLGITQPAASSHIQSLENFIGRPLFIRKARGMVPTPVADDLARTISPYLDEIETKLNQVMARSNSLDGTIHIAGPSEYIAGRIAEKLTPLLTNGLQIRLYFGGKDKLYELLDTLAVDFIIMSSIPSKSGVEFIELGSEQHWLVASPTIAKLFKSGTPDLELLKVVPFVAYDETSSIINTLFQSKTSVSVRPVATAPDFRVLLSLVCANAGWSILPDYICRDSVQLKHLVIIPAFQKIILKNQLYLVWRKEALRHQSVSYVRDYLNALAKVGEFNRSFQQKNS